MPESIAIRLVRLAGKKGMRIAVAESCTAGLVASLLGEVPGASRVLWGSLVTYTPEAKIALLGLDRELLERCGEVSQETALAMATGARGKSGAALAVSVTGLAGPEGDSSGLPVGTVWIGISSVIGEEAREYHFTGKRNQIRLAAAREALGFLCRSIE